VELGGDFGVGDVDRDDLAILLELGQNAVTRGLAPVLIHQVAPEVIGRAERGLLQLRAELLFVVLEHRARFSQLAIDLRRDVGVRDRDLEILRLLNDQLVPNHVVERLALDLASSGAVLRLRDLFSLDLGNDGVAQIVQRDDLITDNRRDAVEADWGRRLTGLLRERLGRTQHETRRGEKNASFHIPSSTHERGPGVPWPSQKLIFAYGFFAPAGGCAAGESGRGSAPPGSGTEDFGWLAAFAESAEARTRVARSSARSMPAWLTDASYFASR